MSEQRFEDVLDECINRMLAGESWQQVISAYPAHAAALLPALQGAEAMARVQFPGPSPEARAAAQQHMLSEVASPRPAAGNAVAGGLVAGWMSWFKMRPPATRMAAVGAAAVMFGAVTMGAAAATGNAPDPVKSIFGVSDSVIRVAFIGAITAIEDSTLTVDANGDLRSVRVDGRTDFGDDYRTLADLAVGDVIEVKGRLQADNSVRATEIRLAGDDDDDDTTETPVSTATPPATAVPPTAVPTQDDDDDETPDARPTADDDDDGDDDDGDDTGGAGTGGDDGADDDNSGAGSGDDDDNSGSGDDDESDYDDNDDSDDDDD